MTTMERAWQERFGSDPPIGVPDLSSFLAHRSVRRFSEEEVSEATISALIAAAQSASTSSMLQLWTAISVQDPERRKRIAELCANQKQVHSAPWFFAFCADHHRIREAAAAAGQNPAGVDFEEFYIMAIIDVALAAERMVCAAESAGLGVCYIGALRNDVESVQKLLDLPTGTIGLFGLCLGWPADLGPEAVKPRLPLSAVWHRETYNHNQQNEVKDFDRRMAQHYTARGLDSEVSWSSRMGKRVDGSPESLTGREKLHEWVRTMGVAIR